MLKRSNLSVLLDLEMEKDAAINWRQLGRTVMDTGKAIGGFFSKTKVPVKPNYINVGQQRFNTGYIDQARKAMNAPVNYNNATQINPFTKWMNKDLINQQRAAQNLAQKNPEFKRLLSANEQEYNALKGRMDPFYARHGANSIDPREFRVNSKNIDNLMRTPKPAAGVAPTGIRGWISNNPGKAMIGAGALGAGGVALGAGGMYSAIPHSFGEAAGDWIKENPWASAGIGGLGLMMAMAMMNRGGGGNQQYMMPPPQQGPFYY